MKLVSQLEKDFPQLVFAEGEVCRWDYTSQTVFYSDNEVQLLHELGHALLDHQEFSSDIELLHMERGAWEKARELAKKYGCKLSIEAVETAMDSYRRWLHFRALCPTCRQLGVQTTTNKYLCYNCATQWKPNDARQVGLKRYRTK
jgi:hypothetical protein